MTKSWQDLGLLVERGKKHIPSWCLLGSFHAYPVKTQNTQIW